MYLALYRKYRPQTFSDVVSQEHITATLKNQITSGKTAHAYLFTGSRGTGKTTCAKIFAKAVNCLNPQNGEPCLECAACRGIEDGSVTDVVEIDAASNNGVENIRELRETAFFTPTFAKYRVYIIDEVHMLSVPAFNALLKIMEEPPAHVKFVLATTEVHKVPITVISRCQRFDFKRIRDEDIANRLKYIADKENVNLDSDAAMLIARLADGALRDGISLLDRILSATDNVTLTEVESAVGVAGSEYLFSLADCIADYNSGKALSIVNELYMNSKDLQRLCSELINHFRNLMLIKSIGDCGELIKASEDELGKLKVQAERFTMGQILTAATRLTECFDKIGKTSGKRIELEMCLIRLCTPKAEKAAKTIEQTLENQPQTNLEVKSKTEEVIIPKLPKNDEVIIPKLPRDNEPPKAVVIPELPKEEVNNYEVEKENANAQTASDFTPNEEELPQELEKTEKVEPTEKAEQNEEHTTVESAEIGGKEHTVSGKVQTEPMTDEQEAKAEENNGFMEVPEWDEIINKLIELAPHLAMMKNEAKALIKGDKFYVGIASPLINAQLKRDGNVAYLKQAIREVLGRDYIIKLKTDSKKPEVEKKPIDTLLADARALGIEIEE